MSDALSRVVAAATPVAEALALLSSLRASPDEGRALDLLLARHRASPLPEPLLLAVAGALVDRGELPAASRLLEGVESSAALLVRADVVARLGAPLDAVALIERTLLRDLEYPGARERRARWLREAGVAPATKLAAPAGATLVTKSPVAPFALERELGRGGSAAVFGARELELGRHVALKLYHHPARDRAQLLHEARVAVALAGPGVVRVFDVDPAAGWLAMELAAGTLRDVVAPPVERWARGLAATLARVHAAGWVHHDVKPANVLLSRSGAPLLTDFGTARRAGEPSPAGSLGYVSPERLAGRASDPRDDVFGFGRVIEEALRRSPDPAARWREVAARCTGPDGARFASGNELVEACG